MQANPEAHGTPFARGPLADVRQLGGHGGWRFAPGQVDIDLVGGEVVGIRLLHGRIECLGVLYLQVLAFEVHGFALQYSAPDLQEFVGTS